MIQSTSLISQEDFSLVQSIVHQPVSYKRLVPRLGKPFTRSCISLNVWDSFSHFFKSEGGLSHSKPSLKPRWFRSRPGIRILTPTSCTFQWGCMSVCISFVWMLCLFLGKTGCWRMSPQFYKNKEIFLVLEQIYREERKIECIFVYV